MAQRDGKQRNLPFFPMLPEAKPRKGTLPQEKYPALLAELPDYLRPVVAIGFKIGMRFGEILELKWDNVMWMDRMIRLEAGTTKNNEAREIPFGDELELMLRAPYAPRKDGCAYDCFRVDRRGHAQPIGDIRNAWYRACIALGLGSMQPKLAGDGQPSFERPRYPASIPKPKMVYNGLIFHDLRRSFVTDAEHAGAPRHEVMAITGHKTESVYKRCAIGDRSQRRAARSHVDAYREQKARGQFGDNLAPPSPEPPVVH